MTDCRPHCGACCTAPSISSPIPGMPQSKPAGVRCVQLDEAERCLLFGLPTRPAVCASLQPSAALCGRTRAEALAGRLAGARHRARRARERPCRADDLVPS